MYLKLFTILLLSGFSAIALRAQPVAAFSSNKTSGCSPLTVQFLDASTGSPASFEWDFGNGNSSIIQSPSATYVNPGTYTVTLKVTGASGTDTETKTAYITVFKNPVADFTMNVTGGCAPLKVNFSSTSTPGSSPITQYLWDYGDGNLNNSQSTPTHTYVSSGNRTLSLTVTDANGCQHTVTKTNAINVTQTHTVNFTGTSLISCSVPLTSSFMSSVVPAGTYTYLWTASNGLTSTLQNPSFTFQNPGEYDITLKVTNPTGCSETVTRSKVVVIPNTVADFLSPPAVCLGKPVTLTNTTTPVNTTTSYRWLLDGSYQSALKDFTFTPSAPGTYTLTLESNDRGCRYTRVRQVVVEPAPKAAFTPDKLTFCKAPATVNFSNQSTPPGSTYKWDFGNGQVSSAATPSVTYTTTGVFPVKLVVTSPQGCQDSVTAVVKTADPLAEIVARNAKSGCAPLNVTFRLQPGQAQAFSFFEWKLNNVVIGSDSVLPYTFADTGIHIVTFRAITPDGCEVTMKDSVKVGRKFIYTFTADKRVGCFSSMRTVKFTPLGSGPGNAEFEWLWDRFRTTDKSPDLVFNDTGRYSITLKVSHNGCVYEQQVSDYIIIYPARAAFSVGTISCASDSVGFANLSVGRNKYWWSFGDTTSSTEAVPKHLYRHPGTYTVRLVALDTVHNCADTATRQVVIPESPVLAFSISDTIGCAPLSVTFKNLSTVGPNGYPIIATRWEFTGQGPNSLANPTVSFTNMGYVKVSMRVLDMRNCWYTLTKDSAVKVIGGKALIGLPADRGCIPFTAEFHDSSVTEFPVTKRKWTWSPLDSLVVTSGAPVQKLFTAPPVPQGAGYTIGLTVTDSFGCSFSGSRKIFPSTAVSTVNYVRNFVCGAQSVSFQAPGNDTLVYLPATYAWTIAGVPSASRTVSRSYTYPDTILPVRLIVTDANKCTVTKDTTIAIVNKKPLAAFYADPPKLDCYMPVRPVKLYDTTVLGSTAVKSWSWVVGPNISDKQHPEFVFPKPGKYGVKLVIEDSAGCRDSVVIPEYVVIGGPLGSYSFAPNKGCMPHQVNFTVFSPNARYYIWDMADGFVDTVESSSFQYVYPRAGVYYPRLTLVDSSGTCAYGYDAIDSIVVHPLPRPDFTVDKSIVCINSTVTFTNNTPGAAGINDWLWVINDTDSISGITPAPRLFSVPGKYKVALTARDRHSCVDSIVKPDFITVIDDTIPPAIPDLFRATVNDNQSNVMEFSRNSEPDFQAYRVYYNYIAGTPASSASQGINDTVFTHAGINTLENPYSYAVAAIDICNNLSLPSEIHTTVELKATAGNNAINLAWTPYAGFDTIARYEVWRNNPDSGTAFVYLDSVDGSRLSYRDTAITCFTTYYYRIKTVEQGGHIKQSWSDTSGAMPDYAPTMPPTRNVRATVVNDSYILLEWNSRLHKIPFRYVIYRMRDDETQPVFYRELTDTFMVDKDVDVDRHSYSYYTYLKDACGGLSPSSNLAKTILLQVNLQENDLLKHDPVIDFTPYRDWLSGVKKYEADFYYDSARAFSPVATLNPADTQFSHRYVNLQQRDYCYQVTAYEDVTGGTTSQSNIACIDTKPRLWAPSAFTINDDGLNERFDLGGVFLDTYHLKVFNRWGQLVFESTDIHTSWDGTISGKPAAADVYVYIAEGTGRHNQRITLKGNVTLLR